MIRIDLSDLTNNLDVEAQLNAEMVKQARDKMGLDLMAGLIQTTPVDTGRARAGWQLENEGDFAVVSNMVPYIGVLNDGHSQQAPAGFVENEMDRVARDDDA